MDPNFLPPTTRLTVDARAHALPGLGPVQRPNTPDGLVINKHVTESVDLKIPDSLSPKIDPKELEKNLQEAIANLNEQMRANGRNLTFQMDKVTDRTVITVKNTQTGDVVRQIPDETLLRVAHNIEKVKGMLLDEFT